MKKLLVLLLSVAVNKIKWETKLESSKVCATCYYKEVCEGVVAKIACGAYKPEIEEALLKK